MGPAYEGGAQVLRQRDRSTRPVHGGGGGRKYSHSVIDVWDFMGGGGLIQVLKRDRDLFMGGGHTQSFQTW